MKKKKGFTLVELLAVIVVLAVIALIAVPTILGVIEKARKASYKDSIYGIIESANIYLATNINSIGKNEEIVFTCNGISCSNNEGDKLSFKGSVPKSGSFYVNGKGQVTVESVYNGRYYANTVGEDIEITEEDTTLTRTELTNLVKELQEQVKELQEQVNNKSEVSQLTNLTSKHDSDVSSINSKVSTLENNFGTLNQKINSLSSKISLDYGGINMSNLNTYPNLDNLYLTSEDYKLNFYQYADSVGTHLLLHYQYTTSDMMHYGTQLDINYHLGLRFRKLNVNVWDSWKTIG